MIILFYNDQEICCREGNIGYLLTLKQEIAQKVNGFINVHVKYENIIEIDNVYEFKLFLGLQKIHLLFFFLHSSLLYLHSSFFVGYYRLSNYFLCNWKVISKVIPVMKKMIRSMIQYNMYNSMKKIIELNSSLWNKFIVDVSTYQRFTGNLY